MAETIFLDTTLPKANLYQQLLPQIRALIEPEKDMTANLANVSAVLKSAFNFFWVGFYILKGDELVLGPFQGPVACTRIKPGKGVCGTAFKKCETIIVPDVDQFEGHIACSIETKSEIVVPVVKNSKVVAVLDVDSIEFNNFDDTDQYYLEKVVELIQKKW